MALCCWVVEVLMYVETLYTIEKDADDVECWVCCNVNSKSLRGIVEQQIANYLVVPNRIPVALVPGIDLSKLKHPIPKVY